MPLNLNPTIVNHEAQDFIYLEKKGPFIKMAPVAWQEFWAYTLNKVDFKLLNRMVGLSFVDPKLSGDDAYTYQAGLFLKSKPAALPEGLSYRKFAGGRFAKFLLTGSYTQFSSAYPQIFSLLQSENRNLRNDFCIEAYLNTPNDTKEEDLLTEILVPISN
jgi:AraC family transcriptional regulator